MKRRIDRKEKELEAEKAAYSRLIRRHAEELQQMKDDLKRFKKKRLRFLPGGLKKRYLA